MTVNNVNALLNYTTPQTAGQPDQAGFAQDDLTRNSFGQVMTKVNDTIKTLQMESAGAVASTVRSAEAVDMAKADKSAQVQGTDKTVKDDSGKAGDATQQRDNKAVENAAVNEKTEAVSDEAVEEVEKSAKELVQKIADEMDVTPEEVEKAMAMLGLVPVELFDIDNLKQLMLTIAGSEDELTLVTDETLYDNMQNLFATVDEILESLQKELGLSDGELDALMERIASLSEGAEAVTIGEDVLAQGTEPADEMPELEGMKDYAVTVHRDGETIQVKVSVDDASGAKSVQEEVTEVPKAEMQGGHKMRERDASADSGKGEGNAFMQAFDKPIEVTEAPASVSAGYQSVQAEDIMNQIMDYMRINLKADTQEMELQLHPASLGTVNVQIAAKDGAITAHFTTQNEAVRAVIETQLIQLKQQFEEQGIKVDAVEVTVANHEYGQQFSQENEDAAQKQGKSGKGTRRINLDEIDEEEDLDEMEESERIAVEMMQANGNTVDFTA